MRVSMARVALLIAETDEQAANNQPLRDEIEAAIFGHFDGTLVEVLGVEVETAVQVAGDMNAVSIRVPQPLAAAQAPCHCTPNHCDCGPGAYCEYDSAKGCACSTTEPAPLVLPERMVGDDDDLPF